MFPLSTIWSLTRWIRNFFAQAGKIVDAPKIADIEKSSSKLAKKFFSSFHFFQPGSYYRHEA